MLSIIGWASAVHVRIFILNLPIPFHKWFEFREEFLDRVGKYGSKYNSLTLAFEHSSPIRSV